MGTLRRLLVFGLLGPPLGYATLVLILIPVLAWLGAQGGVALGADPVPELLLAWQAGVPFALAAALVDGLLARAGRPGRPVWTMLAAAGLVLLPVIALARLELLREPRLLLFGLVGAVPGLLCALLAGRLRRP